MGVYLEEVGHCGEKGCPWNVSCPGCFSYPVSSAPWHIDVSSSALPHPLHQERLTPPEPRTRINIVSPQSLGIWSQRHTSNSAQEVTVMENSQGGGLRFEVTQMPGSLSLPKMMDEVRVHCP